MKIWMMLLSMMYASSAWATDIPDANKPAAQVYAQRCSVCHSLPHPARLDWQHWRGILHVMKQRMDEKQITIPVEEWQQISSYLKAHAD